MENREIIKEYKNGDFTIVWKPATCIHSGICAKTLPQVYDPKARPWVNAENASVDELKAQINQCPSGALSYYIKGEEEKEDSTSQTEVEVRANGPLLVTGTLVVADAEGNSTLKTKKTAFCRCGGSSNKPYCDGTHAKIGFVG
jgi:uncharacterized Fe-S cluster protein YjdI